MRKRMFVLTAAVCLLAGTAAGCGARETKEEAARTAEIQTVIAAPEESTEETVKETVGKTVRETGAEAEKQPDSQGQIDRDTALSIALENAAVSQEDAYNIQVESDSDNGIPLFDIEFETSYGDYDFQIAMEGGEILEADYEVDEEALRFLGGEPVTIEQAQSIVQSKVSGAPLEDIRIWEERDDGYARYEGELFYNSRKYEFEIDPQTGVIFDWNLDWRE